MPITIIVTLTISIHLQYYNIYQIGFWIQMIEEIDNSCTREYTYKLIPTFFLKIIYTEYY